MEPAEARIFLSGVIAQALGAQQLRRQTETDPTVVDTTNPAADLARMGLLADPEETF